MENKKRGRPPVISPAWAEALKQIYPDVTTRRGILNKVYETMGLRVVKGMVDAGEKGLEYLDDPIKEKASFGILRELGKYPADEIPELARYICQKQKETPRTIRYWEMILRKARISETVSDNEVTA